MDAGARNAATESKTNFAQQTRRRQIKTTDRQMTNISVAVLDCLNAIAFHYSVGHDHILYLYAINQITPCVLYANFIMINHKRAH